MSIFLRCLSSLSSNNRNPFLEILYYFEREREPTRRNNSRSRPIRVSNFFGVKLVLMKQRPKDEGRHTHNCLGISTRIRIRIEK